ncbi:hypothetical protein [Mesoaciditoga lauensis]|uniref:hypothetical protein n=1 Tax=Mesoaciditoga lauensis TaxID=1495039 RepID=UPI00055D2AE0|nr:hypothetical protein [Mesoaciditoga lauensis]
MKIKKSIGNPLALKPKGKVNPSRHFMDILPTLAGEVSAEPFYIRSLPPIYGGSVGGADKGGSKF